jgi:hypothetical protein
MKTCTGCQTLKPLDAFDQSKRVPGKLKAMCRTCCRLASRLASANKRRERDENRKGNTYLSRNANLKRLGFATYGDYLASDLWREIRKKVYAAKGSDCYLCGGRATELHHNRYHANDLTGKRLKYINPICRGCHEGIEFRDGEKSTVKQAKRAFRKQRREHLK